MQFSLTFGKQQLAVSLSRKRGRPRNPSCYRLHQLVAYLKWLVTDKHLAGHPASRVLRRVFENGKIKKALGLNLAGLILLTGLATPTESILKNNSETEEIVSLTVNAQEVETVTQHTVRLPLDSFVITQGYSFFHRGVDLKEVTGAPIYPIMDGTVEAVFDLHFGYGKHLIINHGSGRKSLYAHLSKIIAQKDQAVDKNTVIGLVGSTGLSTGSHLHLEIWEDGRPLNPLVVLQ
ncbi:hypothetical protein COT66_01110 [Candidatus Shapirobacteria bacterium CG09_land_8_20_14_0_10_49_15]|uniref:M23ase beta-sheet core domain-containing protein n=1 Tax=Candidatus Shapirobacteria bacterium CG09_land_8_20_14_0_10_49_15 TaxID=1974482 RepID=A0A2M6XBE8_9BACT|nr:MAG: hypothetical protein COT66_01110 [Candidatus Shapirobacteria bacterium CG09_land_8_20_14_0_10_49_15]